MAAQEWTQPICGTARKYWKHPWAEPSNSDGQDSVNKYLIFLPSQVEQH